MSQHQTEYLVIETCDCIETGSADFWMQLASVKPWKFQRDSEGPCQNTPDSEIQRDSENLGNFSEIRKDPARIRQIAKGDGLGASLDNFGYILLSF